MGSSSAEAVVTEAASARRVAAERDLIMDLLSGCDGIEPRMIPRMRLHTSGVCISRATGRGLLRAVELRPFEGDETQAGSTPAARRIPAGGRVVTRHTGVRIATHGDVVSEVLEQAQSAQGIELRVQESQRRVSELVQV